MCPEEQALNCNTLVMLTVLTDLLPVPRGHARQPDSCFHQVQRQYKRPELDELQVQQCSGLTVSQFMFPDGQSSRPCLPQ